MLTVKELFDNAEMQGEIKLYYFDNDRCERIEVQPSDSNYDKDIKFIYSENNTVYIEFDNE